MEMIWLIRLVRLRLTWHGFLFHHGPMVDPVLTVIHANEPFAKFSCWSNSLMKKLLNKDFYRTKNTCSPLHPPKKGRITRPQTIRSEERIREWFREACVRQHGSVVHAWKVMDLNGDARLTYFEFVRGCKEMDLKNARRIWCALGRSGFITLQQVDPKLGEQLGSLAGLIWCMFGTVETAWRTCFNKTGKLRIRHDEFQEACQDVKFKGESWMCFKELCSEKASNGMSRKEFGFLHSWISPGKPDRGFLESTPSRWDLPTQPWVPPQRNAPKNERRKRFKDCLLRSYGTFVYPRNLADFTSTSSFFDKAL